DWNDVQLSLVSGRPISFVMDLYQPLYATRPVVQPELYLSLKPQVYGEAMEDSKLEQLEPLTGQPAETAAAPAPAGRAHGEMRFKAMRGMAGAVASRPAAFGLAADTNFASRDILEQGVASAAQAG